MKMLWHENDFHNIFMYATKHDTIFYNVYILLRIF